MARVYKQYVANMDFKMAAGSPLGEKVYRGTTFEFDGLNVRAEDGTVGMVPFLKGAIQKGWVVPADQFDDSEEFISAPPVAAPMGLGPTRHVGNSTAPRVKVPMVVAEEDSREAMVVRDRTRMVQANNDARHTARRVSAEAGGYSTVDDGEVVRRVSTPAKMSSRVTPETVGAEISRFENSVRIQAQLAPGMRSPKAMPVVSGDDNPSIALRSSQKAPPKGYTEVEGIRFASPNPPPSEAVSAPQALSSSPSISPQEASLRLRMAQSACNDFPENYDFGMPEKKKLARMVADFEGRPDVIRAIWLAETDGFKNAIVQNFPEVFSS